MIAKEHLAVAALLLLTACSSNAAPRSSDASGQAVQTQVTHVPDAAAFVGRCGTLRPRLSGIKLAPDKTPTTFTVRVFVDSAIEGDDTELKITTGGTSYPKVDYSDDCASTGGAFKDDCAIFLEIDDDPSHDCECTQETCWGGETPAPARPPAGDQIPEAPAPGESCGALADGAYCGSDVNGSPDSLYQCTSGSISSPNPCANGCSSSGDGNASCNGAPP